jgi:hypothetical protein
MEDRIKNMLKRYGLSGVNKPKKTPSNPKKSHVVLAKGETKSSLFALESKEQILLLNQIQQKQELRNVHHLKRVTPRTLRKAK